MPTPLAVRPDDPRAVAFRGFVAIAREALRGSADEVFVPDGRNLTDITEPLPAGKRTVRLMPTHEIEERVATGKNRGECIWYAPIDVEVSAMNFGSNAENPVNLWGKLLDAMATPANRTRLRNAGISDWNVTKPATTPMPDTVAVGSIRLDIYFSR